MMTPCEVLQLDWRGWKFIPRDVSWMWDVPIIIWTERVSGVHKATVTQLSKPE